MAELSDKSNVERRLAEWGIVKIIGDYRGARLEQSWAVDLHDRRVASDHGAIGRVTHVKMRHAFSSECLDCGQSPHVCVDDHSAAVCLRCGRDKWL